MADELDGQIKEVEAEIKDVKQQLGGVVAELDGCKQRGEERPDLEARENRLGKELEGLRTKEEILLRAKYGAGCRSWPRCSAHVLW